VTPLVGAVLVPVLVLGNRPVPASSVVCPLTCINIRLPSLVFRHFRPFYGFLNRASQVRILPWARAKYLIDGYVAACCTNTETLA
jgi:hypothetical protein